MPRAHSHLALRIAFIVFSGFTAQAFAAPAQDLVITLPNQPGVELGGADTLTVVSTGGLLASGKTVSLKGATSGAGVTIDNSGRIESSGGRAIDSSGNETSPRNYSITNRAGASIIGSDDALRINSNFPSGSILIDNSGTIRSTGGGQGIDLDAVRGDDVTTTIINRAGGLIRGDLSDGMKTGSNATLINYGEISSGDSTTASQKFDGVDIDSATGVSVYNYGTLSGGRHGITTDLGATLNNYGTIIGRNGSGFGSDGIGTVINYGTITGSANGLQPNGDGDGVDIDLIAHIENYGTIQGTGASGVDKNGFANGSEGIAAGGGYIFNGSGARVSGANSGILVDDGSDGSGVGATTLINHGTIEGLDGFGVKLVGEFDDSVFNNGLISGSNGLALDLGGGDDVLTLGHNSRFVGLVDGGTGNDSVIMDDARGGSFGDSQNFESLQVRQGVWTLTGRGDFSDGGSISSGAELINQGGIVGGVTVDKGGVYAGGGTVGGLDVNGTLVASKALGAAQVNGNLNMGSGSTLAFGAEADGGSATVNVSGNANLNGASLVVNASPGTYPWLSRYTLLEAGSISGTFGSVASDYAFLTPNLSYQPTRVDLTYSRNDIAFSEYANSANGIRAANSLATMSKNNALYNALLNTSTFTAGSAIEQLAGSGNANLTQATLNSSAQVGATMMSAMQTMGGGSSLMVGMSDTHAPTLAATAVPAAARNLNDPNARGRVWLQGIGSYGKLDGEHGSAGLEQRTKGSVLGVDWALTPMWHLGVLGGYSRTDLDSPGLDGKVNTWHVGAYAQRQDGPLSLRLGAAYSRHDGQSKRRVEFDGFSDRPKGNYDADSQQAFAELGYALGSGRLSVEPFANLGYQRYQREGYTEKGGAAALNVNSQNQDNISSTLGLRLAQLNRLDNGMSLTPRGSLGWRHMYGDVDSTTRQAFVLGGSAFNVEGTALDRDSLMVEAGLDLGIAAGHTLGIGYNGELGGNSRNHALTGQWRMSF